MSIYGLNKFQLNNYDSLKNIRTKILNVSESKEEFETRRDEGNVIDLLTMHEEGYNTVCLYRMIVTGTPESRSI